MGLEGPSFGRAWGVGRRDLRMSIALELPSAVRLHFSVEVGIVLESLRGWWRGRGTTRPRELLGSLGTPRKFFWIRCWTTSTPSDGVIESSPAEKT